MIIGKDELSQILKQVLPTSTQKNMEISKENLCNNAGTLRVNTNAKVKAIVLSANPYANHMLTLILMQQLMLILTLRLNLQCYC